MFRNLFFKNVVSEYFFWHFFEVPGEILKGWRNFLKFNLNYFSIPLLLKTLFFHWHRYRYSYGRSFDLKRYFEAFTFNIMSRFIGALLRIFLIFLGLLVEIFIVFAGALVFVGWLILPFLLVAGLLFGFKILI